MGIVLTSLYVIDDSFYSPQGSELCHFYAVFNDPRTYSKRVIEVIENNPDAIVVTHERMKVLLSEKREAFAKKWTLIDQSIFDFCKTLTRDTFKIAGGLGFFANQTDENINFYFQIGNDFFTAIFPIDTKIEELKQYINALD